MAKKKPRKQQAPEPAVLKDRRRILDHVERMKDFLGDAYYKLKNVINDDENPGKAKYHRDRLA